MVAPPGFSIAERYKQYTCVGQTFSSIPSSVPTTAPSVSSSLAPTLTSVVSWSPTYGAGNAPGSVAVATVAVIQTLSGVSLATATSTAFQTTFIQSVANQIGQSANHVVITSVTATSRRKLLAGVNIAYTVTTENTNPTILAQIITSNAAALSQALTTAGYPTTVTTVSATPTTALPQPTLPPVASGATTVQSIQVVSVACNVGIAASFQNNYQSSKIGNLGTNNVDTSQVSFVAYNAVCQTGRRRGLLAQSVQITTALSIPCSQPGAQNVLANDGTAMGTLLSKALGIPVTVGNSALNTLAQACPSTTGGLSAGAIAGIVIACVVAVSLITLLSIFIPKMRNAQYRANTQNQMSSAISPPENYVVQV